MPWSLTDQEEKYKYGSYFIGGVKRIASFTEKVVPVMACLYLLGGLILLVCRIQYIPETFAMIFKYAFVPNAIIGGGIGYALKTAISQGAKRGLFSNEAGMGSTPHAHALANVECCGLSRARCPPAPGWERHRRRGPRVRR